MKKIAQVARLALFVVFSAMAGQSSAAYIVQDPWNVVQNTKTAIASVKSEINTWTSAYQSVRQTIELIKSTASIDGLARIAGLQEELATYRELVEVDKQMRDTLNQARLVYQDLNAQFAAGNVSWKTFLDGKAKFNFANADMMMRQVDTVNKSLEQVNARRQKMLDEVQGAIGQTNATQALGAQIDAIIEQNNQTIKLLQSQVTEKARANGNTERDLETDAAARRLYQQRLDKSAREFQ